jgi:hypothetical protein
MIITIDKKLCCYKDVSSDLKKVIQRILSGDKEEKENKRTVNITLSLVTKKDKKHKVRVFSNFVKVGWDQYSIKRDWLDNEYVIIKGNRYEVVRDIFGQGYLVEL